MKNSYIWDTPEKQSEGKPYGFLDLPEDFLNRYFKKREGFIDNHLKKTPLQFKEKSPILPKEYFKKEKFETSEIISGLYSKIKRDNFNVLEAKHFWRLLKKAELKKLRLNYDKNFLNLSKRNISHTDMSTFSLTLGEYALKKYEGYIQATSTLLKVNDFLISKANELGDLEKSLLSSSLSKEKFIIGEILSSSKEKRQNFIELEAIKENPNKTIIPNLAMILQDTNRSKAYLQNSIKEGLIPNFVYLLKKNQKESPINSMPQNQNKNLFNPGTPLEETIQKNKINYGVLESNSINDDKVIKNIKSRDEEYFVFSGTDLLKEAFDCNKKFIHMHPGKLPDYRGSTCPYYSVLNGDGWWVSSFIMNPGIDEGKLISTKEFPLPRRNVDPTRTYDPLTRSLSLICVLKELRDEGTLKTTNQDLSTGITYYTIHPVLEFIAKDSFR